MKVPWLGAHMSIAGGLDRAIARAEAASCTALQIFTKNASRWQAKSLAAEEVRRFRRAWQASAVGPVVAHASYLINLASPDDDLRQRSIDALRDERQRCHLLGIGGLVVHPGAHMGAGEEAGLARVIASLRQMLAEDLPVEILLENTAGAGTCLGGPVAHLQQVLQAVDGPLALCLDTCHAQAFGYALDRAAGYDQWLDVLIQGPGLQYLRLFHVNDSRGGCGNRKDRHAHIGEGTIGIGGFRRLMQDPRLASIPRILETPKGDDDSMDRINLLRLRALAAEVA